MPLPTQRPPDGKHWRVRPLKRGDKDAAFRMLADDGWVVPASEQDLAISWIVQHPEMETLVAHDAGSYSRLFGMITLSHRPQLRLGGRVASIDLFVVSAEERHKGIGHDLFAHSLRRAEALGCKRIEVHLPPGEGERLHFFKGQGFELSESALYIRALKPRG